MKRNFIFAAVLTLFVMAVSVSAQKASYAGTWTLDIARSKLGERVMVESQTLTVVQSDKDIKVSTATKRAAPPAGAPGGGGPGGRPAGGSGMGESSLTYALDGKEMTTQLESPMGAVPVKTTGKSDGGKLWLSNSSTRSTPNGDVTVTTKESWSLSADGNTLTVDKESVSPRGTTSTQWVYTRKS